MSGVIHGTEVAPIASTKSAIVWLPIVTLTHTWRYDARNTSSDIVQVRVTAPAAGRACPFVGDVIVTVGGPFAGSPGSMPRLKSPGRFVSVQFASRCRMRPGPGAGASPMIVFPGSQSSVPPRVALNSTRSTTMSRPAADALAPPGFRYTSLRASPVGLSHVASGKSYRLDELALRTLVNARLDAWYVPGASGSRE